jgi:hypothetical protein
MFFEKYGLLGAITTVIAVVFAVVVQLVVISKWTGAIEEQARAMCLRISVLESFKETANTNFTPRGEHNDVKDSVTIQREMTARALEDIRKSVERLSDKLDRCTVVQRPKGT